MFIQMVILYVKNPFHSDACITTIVCRTIDFLRNYTITILISVDTEKQEASLPSPIAHGYVIYTALWHHIMHGDQ